MSALLLAGLFACAPPELAVDSQRTRDEIVLRSTLPVDRVELRDLSGQLIRTRRLQQPSTQVSLFPSGGASRAYRVSVYSGDQRVDQRVAPFAVDGLTLELWTSPLGPPLSLHAGQRVALPLAARVSVPLVIWSEAALSTVLQINTLSEPIEVQAGGEARVSLDLEPGRTLHLQLNGRGYELAPVLRARSYELALSETDFPVSISGERDGVRERDCVRLPSLAWASQLARVGLGYRASADQRPWGYEAIAIENRDAQPVDLLVRVRTLDEQLRPHPAFAPHLRDAGSAQEQLSTLIRVPANQSVRTVFPVYVDAKQLGDETSVVREVSLYRPGQVKPLLQRRRPIAIRSARPFLGLGVAFGLVSSLIAWVFGLFAGARWLARAQTGEVLNISTLAALHFIGGSAVQGLSLGLGALLGPFSAFLTGVPDQLLRTALLLTLLSKVPRVGAIALMLFIEQLLRAFSWGLQPLDLFLLGLSVFSFEGMAWLMGLTRGGAWRYERRRSRVLRVGIAFLVANLVVNAAGLAIVSVLYRMYFSTAYVSAMLIIPSGLYVLLSVPFAVDFADHMRRVQQ